MWSGCDRAKAAVYGCSPGMRPEVLAASGTQVAEVSAIGAYRDTFRLLLGFVHDRTGTPPSALDIADLDAPIIGAFLEHLERDRRNSARTRNARLAAVHSLFRYAALRHPEHSALIQQVIAIPLKRFDHSVVHFRSPSEVDALLAAPDPNRWIGRRDHALLLVQRRVSP